jgi:uncharacterized protein YmfQ (DUF2313 family)
MTDPDKHTTRSGEDYADAMQALLPRGQAWPRHLNSVLMQVVTGLTRIWGDFEIRASKLLEVESDPRITIELLPDWERNWGLPDPCYTAPTSLDERHLALMTRMTIEGWQSREFFIELAASIGYAITITEFRPFFIAMDRCGDSRVYGDLPPDPMRNEWGQPIMNARGDAPVADGALSEWPHYGLGPLSNRYYWTVHVGGTKLVWFRVTSGQCGIDPHLRIGIADDLECILNRWKPAHTSIVFDYSGLSTSEIVEAASAADTVNAGFGYAVAIVEAATAAAAPSAFVVAPGTAAVVETAIAVDAPSASVTAPSITTETTAAASVQDATVVPSRSAMVPGVFINPGASRDAYANGVMVNLR